jgi:hypothetical protein
MGLIGNVFGVPKKHEEEKKEHEVVRLPEFDITQYGKKLGLIVGTVVAAAFTAMEVAGVEEVTEGMVIASLGVAAAALLGICLLMATDLVARAYITASGAAEEPAAEDPPTGSEVVATSPGTMVWLENGDEPHPLLAIATNGGEASSYLIAAGSKVSRTRAGTSVDAIGGAPKWHAADAVRAVKPAEWP